MNYPKILNGSFLLLSICLVSCDASQISSTANSSTSVDTPPLTKIKNDEFAAYWYQGEAEVSSYRLEQSRYGETRDGEAVLVFVTEDFSATKQVKLDDPEAAGEDKVSVLKLNNLRKFKTGIYDYSMMESVFTPVDLKNNPHTLKATTSSQEWCGHTFTQINLEKSKYKITEFSYFESEGDQVTTIDQVLLEDELWTRLRINPGSIPLGNVMLLPSVFFSRLAHEPLAPKQARISMQKGEGASILKVEYLHLERNLIIRFESDFPFKILYFQESDGQENITQAVLKKSLKSNYWAKNSNKYESLRDSLELDY